MKSERTDTSQPTQKISRIKVTDTVATFGNVSVVCSSSTEAETRKRKFESDAVRLVWKF